MVAADGSVYETVFVFKTKEDLATLFSFATLTNPASDAYPDDDLVLATEGVLSLRLPLPLSLGIPFLAFCAPRLLSPQTSDFVIYLTAHPSNLRPPYGRLVET